MAKKLIAFYKKGDQVSEMGRKDGHLINFIYAENAIEQAGTMDHKAFAVVLLNDSMLPALRAGIEPIGFAPNGIDIPDMLKFSRAGMKIDYEKLQIKTGDFDLINKLNAKGVPVPLINGTELSLEDFKDPLLKTPDILDLNLITAGTFLIAGPTPAYAGLSNYTADFGATLTTIESQIDGTHTDAGKAGYSETVASGGSITFTSNSDPLGDPTAGYKVTVDGSGHYLDGRIQGNLGQDNLIIEKLWFERAQDAVSKGLVINVTNNVFNIIVRNILLDLGGHKGVGFYIADNSPVAFVNNMKIWSSEDSATQEALRIDDGNANNKIQNVDIWDAFIGVDNFNQATKFRNVVAHGCNTNWNGMTNATVVNCGTGDAGAIGASSEAGTINNVVNGSYQSVDDTNANFLKQTASGILDKTGSAAGLLASNNVGIAGNPRPDSDGLVSVGANEKLASSAGNFIWDRTYF